MSEEIGLNENEMLLSSEMHLRDVNNIIKGVIIDDPGENFNEKDDLNEKNNFDEEDDLENDNKKIVAEGWTVWAENIFLDAQEIARNSHNGSVVNAYYNPEAAKKIKYLINYLPL